MKNHLLSISVGVILSIFATVVMSYISMAAPIGPWIAPTLVLLGTIFFALIYRTTVPKTRELTLATIAGSGGGIIATAFGFSFPTLYFIDPVLFNQWVAQPWYFIAVAGGLALAAGGLGFVVADTLEHQLIVKQKLPFPIGQLVYKMISAADQVRKAWQLVAGFIGSLIFSTLQSGAGTFAGIIPRSLSLIAPRAVTLYGVTILSPLVRFDIAPLWWAVGFVTGHVIALPLFAGAILRIICVDPINACWFQNVSSISFILAFCTGMIVASTIPGLVANVQHLYRFLVRDKRVALRKPQKLETAIVVQWLWALGLSVLFLSLMGFSLLTQLYLILFTLICVYQMVIIAGKTGLALLGRFATFVMVPALFLFNLTTVHVMIIATFVEIAGGFATDILFGRKIAQLSSIERSTVRWYQLLGLVVSALSIGVIFLVLIKQFGLGSEQLFVQKAQARAMLINVRSFDFSALGYVLIIGAFFGHLLKLMRVNPMMALGGILMPLNITIGLVTGGLLATLVKDKEEWYPFWSGVYAAESLWMLVKAVI